MGPYYDCQFTFGELLSDTLSGFTGKVGAVAFYPDGPPRIQLVAVADGKVEREWFDATALVAEPAGF